MFFWQLYSGPLSHEAPQVFSSPGHSRASSFHPGVLLGLGSPWGPVVFLLFCLNINLSGLSLGYLYLSTLPCSVLLAGPGWVTNQPLVLRTKANEGDTDNLVTPCYGPGTVIRLPVLIHLALPTKL